MALEACASAPVRPAVSAARAVLLRDMRHKKPAVRASALAAARGLLREPFIKEARRLLGDPHPRVRLGAAVMLARTPQGAAVLGRLLAVKQGDVHAGALGALVRLPRAVTLAALIGHARHRHPGVRVAAINGLGEHRGEEVHKLLLTALQDRHLGVRLAAVEALGRRGPGAARAALGRVARQDDLYMALRAALALARRGKEQPLRDNLARGLAHPRWTVRAAALNAAISSRHREAAELSTRALADAQPGVRLIAARVLLSDSTARPRALRVARSDHAQACKSTADPWLCVQAAEVLALAGEGAGVTTLEHLARRGPVGQVRAAALRTILLLRPAQKLAVDALTDPDPSVRHTAAGWILGTV